MPCRVRKSFAVKDFRTLHGTIVAADSLARPGCRERDRAGAAMRRAVVEVSEALGNTPTVAKASYIDPEVFERFEAGASIGLGRSASGAALLR